MKDCAWNQHWNVQNPTLKSVFLRSMKLKKIIVKNNKNWMKEVVHLLTCIKNCMKIWNNIRKVFFKTDLHPAVVMGLNIWSGIVALASYMG